MILNKATGLVYKTIPMTVRAADDGSGKNVVPGIVSSSRRDLMGDRIMPVALRTWRDEWARDGEKPIHFLREHDRTLICGTWGDFVCRDCDDDEVELVSRGTMDPDLAPTSELSKLIAKGLVKGLSVGMRITAMSWNRQFGGLDIFGINIVETSAVIFPANEDAMLERRRPFAVMAREGDKDLLDLGKLEEHIRRTDIPDDLVRAIIGTFQNGPSGRGTSQTKSELDLLAAHFAP